MAKANGKKPEQEIGTLSAIVDLTDKQNRFVEEYCVDFNATQAAIRAGYSENSAGEIGSQNLKKLQIRSHIQDRLTELTMSSAEAAMRLTRWGRGSVEPFMRITGDGEFVVDLATAEAQESMDLVKKVRQTENTVTGKDGTAYSTVRTELELHDAKDAVVQIAKFNNLASVDVRLMNRLAEVVGRHVVDDVILEAIKEEWLAILASRVGA